MQNVFSGEILNITPFKQGFVFAAKGEAEEKDKLVVNFYGYDAVNDAFSHIKRSVFLKVKFGYEYDDIAKQLGIRQDRVNEHVAAILTKIGAANRTEAVAIALRKHLLKI